MKKHLLRSIALLLVPCLVADPVCAAGIHSLGASPTTAHSQKSDPFHDQAIVAALVGGLFSFSFDRIASAQELSIAGRLLKGSQYSHEFITGTLNIIRSDYAFVAAGVFAQAWLFFTLFQYVRGQRREMDILIKEMESLTKIKKGKNPAPEDKPSFPQMSVKVARTHFFTELILLEAHTAAYEELVNSSFDRLLLKLPDTAAPYITHKRQQFLSYSGKEAAVGYRKDKVWDIKPAMFPASLFQDTSAVMVKLRKYMDWAEGELKEWLEETESSIKLRGPLAYTRDLAEETMTRFVKNIEEDDGYQLRSQQNKQAWNQLESAKKAEEERAILDLAETFVLAIFLSLTLGLLPLFPGRTWILATLIALNFAIGHYPTVTLGDGTTTPMTGKHAFLLSVAGALIFLPLLWVFLNPAHAEHFPWMAFFAAIPLGHVFHIKVWNGLLRRLFPRWPRAQITFSKHIYVSGLVLSLLSMARREPLSPAPTSHRRRLATAA